MCRIWSATALPWNNLLSTELPPNDSELEARVVSDVRMLLEQKTSPVIIVDGNAYRN